MKPLKKVKIRWTTAFSYVIGIITTDGNLSSDGRHISVTSRDRNIITTIKKCLNLKNKIGRKGRGGNLYDKKYYVLQFGDVIFYNYLLSIGLKQAKSKSLNELKIPDKFFSHFLRGCIDGDGSIGYYGHPESKHPQFKNENIFRKPIVY